VELCDFGDPGLALALNRLAAALAVVTLIRLVVAGIAPLAPDEAYYWVWSHVLAPGYVDHPPMVALWIRAGTALLGQTALGVRLLGPLAAAVASWLLFDTGRVLFPGTKAGAIAVVLLNASLLLGVGSVIMTPDTPLVFCWTATLWALARIAAGGPGGWWLVAGLFGGLALVSKYTGLFLWIGAGLWILLVPAVRPWLRRWQPWAASAVGLVLFAPVLAWNAAHGWAGLVRQGGRVDDWRPARAAQFLAELVGGQIGLATPLVWALCMTGLAVAMRRSWPPRDPGWSLLTALSLPPLLVFLQHATGDRVQGNWPAIIYPALAIAAGVIASRRWWVSAAGLGFAFTALAYIQATTEVLPLPAQFDPIGMRLAGWDDLARQVQASRMAAGAAYVVADGYGLASELAWWLPAGVPVVGTDRRWKLTTLPAVAIAGETGLLIRDQRRSDPPEGAKWIGTIVRTGVPGGDFSVYRVAGIAGTALPRR